MDPQCLFILYESESERESGMFSSIFVIAQCEHEIGFSMNSFESDVAFADLSYQYKRTLKPTDRYVQKVPNRGFISFNLA